MELSIDQLCAEDYLHRDMFEYYLTHPGQDSGFELDEIKRFIDQLAGGEDLPVHVYKHDDSYYVLVDDRELVSAYHCLRYVEIPVDVLQPDDLRIPAYVRQGKSIDSRGEQQWN